MEAGAGHSGLLLMRFLLQQPVLRVKDIEKVVVSYTKANSIVTSAGHPGMLNLEKSVEPITSAQCTESS
jgi:hypothetical protein